MKYCIYCDKYIDENNCFILVQCIHCRGYYERHLYDICPYCNGDKYQIIDNFCPYCENVLYDINIFEERKVKL